MNTKEQARLCEFSKKIQVLIQTCHSEPPNSRGQASPRNPFLISNKKGSLHFGRDDKEYAINLKGNNLNRQSKIGNLLTPPETPE